MNITNKVERGQMEGIRINRTCPTIHHLFFADDSLVFIKATEQSAKALAKIVSTYGEASGQSINLAKSCVFFGKITTTTTQQGLKKS